MRQVLVVATVVGLVALASAGTASAANYTVTTTADSSDGACTPSLCSLRDAVEAADSHTGGVSTIMLPAGSYKLTIVTSGIPFDPTTGDLDIYHRANVTINGAGAGSTIINANTDDRAFTVHAGAGLSLSGLTIADGQPQTDVGIGCGICGGGIWSQGALALSHVTVTSSNGNNAGGAIYTRRTSTLSVTDSAFVLDSAELGGAILTSSDSTDITGSTFSSNVAFRQGGAIQTQFGPVSIDSSTFSGNVSGLSAGAIEQINNSAVTVDDSSFVNNNSTSVAGVIEDIETAATTLTNSRFVSNTANASGVLDVIAPSGQVKLKGDEFDDNNAQVNGVGDFAQLGSLTATDSSFVGNRGGFGAVFQLNNGTISLSNVTMTDNSSPDSGGALYFNAAQPLPTSLTNDTIAGNSAAPGGGGGIFNTSQMASGPGAGVRNTIIAGNSGGDCGDAGSSSRVRTAVDAGFNLDSDGSCFSGATDKVGVNPLLGPPADNGGPVLTDALKPGSPAVDGGTNAGCPTVDARGVSRPQGASCDVGAYEFETALLLLSKSAPASATTGVPFTYTLKATNRGPGLSTDTRVVDRLQADSRVFGISASQGFCTSAGSPATVTCDLGDVASGARATVRIVVAVSQPETAINMASVSNGEGAIASASATTVVRAPVAVAGAGAPKATTGFATAIRRHRVTLHGRIDSGGQPTTYFFRYGKHRPLRKITAVRRIGSSSSVTAHLARLSPGTWYRYRLVAFNDSGTSQGRVRTFRTRGHKARRHHLAVKLRHRGLASSARGCTGDGLSVGPAGRCLSS